MTTKEFRNTMKKLVKLVKAKVDLYNIKKAEDIACAEIEELRNLIMSGVFGKIAALVAKEDGYAYNYGIREDENTIIITFPSCALTIPKEISGLDFPF